MFTTYVIESQLFISLKPLRMNLHHGYWYEESVIGQAADGDSRQADSCVRVVSRLREICGPFPNRDPLLRERRAHELWSVRRIRECWRIAVNAWVTPLPMLWVTRRPGPRWQSDLVVEHRLQDADVADRDPLHKASQSVIKSITNGAHISLARDTRGSAEVMVHVWGRNSFFYQICCLNHKWSLKWDGMNDIPWRQEWSTTGPSQSRFKGYLLFAST